MPRGGASIKAGVLRAGRPTNNVGSGHTGRTRSDTGGLWGRKAARSAWAIGAAGDREAFTKYENEDNIDNDERYQNSDNGGTSEDSEDSGEDDSRYSDGLHFPPTLAREWNPRSSDITPAERAEAALGAFLITIMTLPILYLILFEVLGRYGSRLAADSERDILIVFMTVSAVACFGFLYSCISQFHGRRTLDPSWAAPRLTLFLEVHPILGWFFPITSYLRGYIGFSILRWLLNLAAMVLFVAGHTVLRPAYMEACCYGTEILQGSTPGGSCMDRSLRNTIGFSICDPDGQSENHKLFNKLGIAFVVLSCTMQLLNICTIDWDVINRIGQLQREIDEDGLRIENKDGVDRSTTINLRLIMQLMGLPKRLESLCFPGYEEPTLPETTNPFEIIRRREKAIHEHPHWAHPGLLRLLCLDPIFGFLLSVHDFTAYHDLRGFVRVFLNIFGTVLCVLSIEVLQPMHQAWCCYGKGHEIWDEHVNGTSYTCLEWANLNVHDVFMNSRDFPNGECMRFDTIGLAASISFATGLAMIIFSMMLWVYTYVAVQDSCQRIAHNCMRLVRPSERILLLQVFDWIGIEHGKVKLY